MKDGDRFRPAEDETTTGDRTSPGPSIVVHLLMSGFFATVLLLISIDPRIATIVPSVYAARESFRSGWWLWWHDPERSRARLCFGFYVALAIWQTAASAFGSLMVYMMIQVMLGAKPPLDPIFAVLSLFAGGLILSSAMTAAMAVAALILQRKVWLNPLVYRDCGGDPRRLRELRGRPNRHNLGFLLMATSFGLILAVTTIIPTVILLGPGPGQRPAQGAQGFGLMLSIWSGVIVSAAGTMSLCEKLSAKTPLECWS